MTGTISEFGNDLEKSATKAADEAVDLAKQATGDKSFIDRARQVIEEAVDVTTDAIQKNPVAAAAIVGGVAATVAGAAYGVSKLREGAATTDKK